MIRGLTKCNWVSQWLSDCLSEKVTTREAITFKNYENITKKDLFAFVRETVLKTGKGNPGL